MKIIRQTYFYLVALISVEVVIWGVIDLITNGLLRMPAAGTSSLAMGLSLVLVGVPIFILHWGIVQRDSSRDLEERASRLRALFLYAVRMSTRIAVVQNILALINRLLLGWMGFHPGLALVGSGDSNLDNLAVVVVNLIAWFYFERILRRDWDASLPGSGLAETRRFARYLWVVYTLGLATLGVHQLLSFILLQFSLASGINHSQLPNALALVVVGTPLWVWSWQVVQGSLRSEAEHHSSLRLVVLYLLSLSGVITFMSTSTYSFSFILRGFLGEAMTPGGYIFDHHTALSSAAVFGVIWAYYGRILQLEITSQPHPLKRAELWRPYYYLMSILSNSATYIGLWYLLDALVQLSYHTFLLTSSIRVQVSASLSALLVGLPIWLRTWGACQQEAHLVTSAGDHARRSVIRKAYLYFAVFGLVVTAMVVAGMVFFLVLDSLLGSRVPDFWESLVERIAGLVLTVVWLGYHIRVLRLDGVIAQQALGERHAAYPVLLIGTGSDPLADEIIQALQSQAPRLPLTFLDLNLGFPAAEHLAAKAVLMPASLALDPPENLRAWLEQSSAQRLLIPSTQEVWLLLGTQARSRRETARLAAQAVRRLAEGQAVQPAPAARPWMVVLVVMGALFALQLLLGLFGVLMSWVLG